MHPPGIPEMLEKTELVEEDKAACGSVVAEATTEVTAEVGATTDDEAVVETTMAEEEEAAALMTNGKDHWKVLTSESRKMAIPYVAKLPTEAGMVHLYDPSKLLTEAKYIC